MSTINVTSKRTAKSEDNVERHTFTKKLKRNEFQGEVEDNDDDASYSEDDDDDDSYSEVEDDDEDASFSDNSLDSNSSHSSRLSSRSVSENSEDGGNKSRRKSCKMDKIKIWEGFVIFSQFEALLIDQQRYNGWDDFDALSSWDPYSANMKQVALYLHILECKRKMSSQDRDFCVNQILEYLPHLMKEEMPQLEVRTSKTAFEVTEKKDKLRIGRIREKQSQLEFQIKLAEKDEASLTEYEKMRLTNLRERFTLFKTLGIEKDRKAEDYPDVVNIIFSAINIDQPTMINTRNLLKGTWFGSSKRYNSAIWKDFVQYCGDIQQDTFLAQPIHVKGFIEEVFEKEASFKLKNRPSPLLENYPNFYQGNVINICKHLGYYLKFEYEEGSLVGSNPIKALLSLFCCLDQKLIEPTLNFKKGDSDLIKKLTPKYWYVNHKSNSKDFWKQKLVRDILTDVRNKVLTEGEAAWELGVTPDMLACAINKINSSKPDVSLTIKEYVRRGFGSEESFWEETSTEMLLEDIRNRIIDVDSAAFQIGASFAQLLKKVGKIKTAFEVKEEKDRLRIKQIKEQRANAPPKQSQLEFQIKLAEKDEASLTEYEKMRLTNMRERFTLFNTLGFEKDKKAFKVSQPVFLTRFIEPRQKSSRIKNIAEKKDRVQIDESFDEDLDRLSPLWVGKRTPVSTVELATDPIEQVTWELVDKQGENLSLDKLSSRIPVPKLDMAASELIVGDRDFSKSTTFIQRLESEVNFSGNEGKLKATVDTTKWIQTGRGKVSNDELISLDISEELIAFGDKGGGVGFWLGEKSLIFRPHNAPVCRTVFAGKGTSTRVLSASHDGTVRSYDASSQTFELAFSWNKFYNHKQGVVWLELVDENSMLLNCEEGDVLNVDRRDRKATKVLSLPKSRRSCQSQILISEKQEEYIYSKGKRLDKSYFATPALVGSNLSIHPVNRNLISLCDDETVVIYDMRNCGKPISSISTYNELEESTWNSTLSHHCGCSWSHSGDHFLTYERSTNKSTNGHKQVLHGTVNVYSHHQVASGQVPEKLSQKLPKYEPVYSYGQGIVWSPWQDDVYYFVENYFTKKLHRQSAVVGVDVNSGTVVGELNLPTRAGSMFGCHPTRTQVILANVNETGDMVIYKEEQVEDY